MMAEREIDLIDLIADILSHWRGLLVCLLVGALLMGGFSYVRSYQSTGESQGKGGVSGEKVAFEEQLQKLGALLNDSQKVAVYTVLDDEQEYASYQQYMDKSVLMQMDPYSIPEIDMLYKIQTDDIWQSYMMKSIYEDLVNSVGMLQWVEEQTGISSISAGELIITQEKSSGLLQDEELEFRQDKAFGSDCLKVTVIHYDETECERLAQCVKDYIERQYKQLVRELGAHEVILLSESAGVVMDTGVRDRQWFYSNNEITLLTDCAKAKDAFTKDQLAYYELLKSGDEVSEVEDGPEVEKEPVVVKPSISIKYVAVGAVAFAFIYAGVLLVLYVLSGKLRAIDELQKLYNISQLGLIVKDDGKKKFFIDRWIATLRNWNKRRFTREQTLELAAAAIKISAGKQELDTVCLMGCDLKAGADVVCQELKERLEQDNVTVRILDNVLYDAETMEELENVKGIVLVEKAMSTMYNEILSELELASRQGIKILGGIVVE